MVTSRCRAWLVVCLVVATVAAASSCRSKTSRPDESARELVGSPTRPGPTLEEPPAETPDAPPIRRGALWYRLELRKQTLEIKVRLLKPASRTSFFLPTLRDSDSRDRPPSTGRAFAIEGAHGPEGRLPIEQHPDEGRLDVETEGLKWVELDYSVDLTAFPDRSDRATPAFSGGTALVYAPDVLVVPSKQVVSSIREIPIEIHTPTNWNLQATWSERGHKVSSRDDGRRVHGYVTEDVGTLRDAFFVAGPELKTRRPRIDGAPVTVAFGPRVRYDHDDVAELVARLVDLYRRQFGPVGPVVAYFHGGSGDGEADGVRGTAKRRGFVVRVDHEESAPGETALLIAHEAFHLWNGHKLVPSPTHEEETRWFKEGATHYVALKMLLRAGLFDDEALRRELARSAFYYRRNPAARGQRASALDMHRLPYDRGLLLALRFDAALVQCTAAKRSITGWIEALLERDTRFYNTEALRQTFEQVAGDECGKGMRAWRRFVEREATLDPSRIFAGVGLHLLEARSLDETKLLPVEGHSTLYRKLFLQRDDTNIPTRTSAPGPDHANE